MTKSQSIGVAAVVSVILVGVSWGTFHSASARPGITITETPKRSADQSLAANASRPSQIGSGSQATDNGPQRQIGPAAARPAVPDSTTSNAGDPLPVSSHLAGQSEQPAEIVVQVAGAVKKPGVYHLAATSRNDDAVKAAGGLAGDANAASVNLAAHAVDGSQLYIKTRNEQPNGGVTEESTPATKPLASTSASKSAVASAAHRTSRSGGGAVPGAKPAKLKDPSEGKININTASAEELQRISGIGPAMAEKIIAYRQENHGFQSAEDLMQVSGIGAKKFAKFAPFVKIR